MKIVRSVKNPNDIRKVRNTEAASMVKQGSFTYASKELWKKLVRDVANVSSN